MAGKPLKPIPRNSTVRGVPGRMVGKQVRARFFSCHSLALTTISRLLQQSHRTGPGCFANDELAGNALLREPGRIFSRMPNRRDPGPRCRLESACCCHPGC